MTMKNDTKFKQELTCQFKIDMRNLTNFDPSTQKVICTLTSCFQPKYIMFELKKSIEELSLIALTIDPTSEEKRTSAFKNDMRNLSNFHQRIFGNLKIGFLMGYFYSN